MPQCIFCLQEKEQLTDEHVFPAALGGVLVLKASVCAECNHSFSKFEQPLVTELAPLRALLKIPDRYGKLPQVAATIKTPGKDFEGRVKSDGSVQLKRVVTEIKGGDGKREFIHQFLTERQKEELRAEAKKKGFQFIESGPGKPVQGEVHVGGDLECIGSSEGLRTTAKIAYVGLAFRAGTKLATGESFNEIRSYIREGTGKPLARLFVNQFYSDAVQQGPHQHSITLAGRCDKKRVDAIVRLFGGLNYFVTLSDDYSGADFSDTLVYDAYRGEPNGMLFSHEQAEFLQTEDVATSSGTRWDDLPASGKFFCDFLNNAIWSKMERGRSETAKEMTNCSDECKRWVEETESGPKPTEVGPDFKVPCFCCREDAQFQFHRFRRATLERVFMCSNCARNTGVVW